MSLRTTLALTAALALAAPMAQAAVIYDEGITNTAGQYSDVGTKTIGFSNLGGSQAISFVLVGGRSVDGFNVSGYDDLFSIALNGVTVFEGYFNMSGGGTNSVITNTLGWTWSTIKSGGGTYDGGFTTVSGMANLLSGANTFAATFAAVGPSNGGSQGTADESWGLNALTVSGVSTVPVPATLPLMAAGLGAFGFFRRKR